MDLGSQGIKKTNQPSETEGLLLDTGQKSQLSPRSTSHFKAFQMLPSGKGCTCTYLHAMQVIKASPKLLPNLLKMTTLHHKTLCVT